MNKKYEIKTLKDIRDKIPSDRLDAFLADLKIWVLREGMEIAEQYASVMEEVAKAIGVDVKVLQASSETMMWVDDGQTGLSQISVNMVNIDGTETPLQTVKIQREAK